MPQINFHTTVEFELDLLSLMMAARIPTKSQAIRYAVHELAAAYNRCAEGAQRGGDADQGSLVSSAGSSAESAMITGAGG
jgi:hypothetical protein